MSRAGRQRGPGGHSALIFVLKGFVPYTHENYLLACRPNQFFNELEKTSDIYSRSTLRNAYWRAKQQGFIQETNAHIKLTPTGLKRLRPFIAECLGKDARLIVMFDIPEKDVAKRHALRRLLKAWEFQQVQKSVWVTDMDYRSLLVDAVRELDLGNCVEIHESLKIYP